MGHVVFRPQVGSDMWGAVLGDIRRECSGVPWKRSRLEASQISTRVVETSPLLKYGDIEALPTLESLCSSRYRNRARLYLIALRGATA